jgi:hypothetical protein
MMMLMLHALTLHNNDFGSENSTLFFSGGSVSGKKMKKTVMMPFEMGPKISILV